MGVHDMADFLALAGGVLWLSLLIFLVVVSWRAMRALEGIDASLRERNSR